MNETTHWISCRAFTVRVEARDGIITWAAPVVRKFAGQPLSCLLSWASDRGDLRHEEWPTHSSSTRRPMA